MHLRTTPWPRIAGVFPKHGRAFWLTGAALLTGLSMRPAYAGDECGSVKGGTIVCTAAGNPYAAGVNYLASAPLSLLTNPDTVITGPIQIAGGSGTLAVTNMGASANTAYGRDAISVYSNQDAVISGTGTITNSADYGGGVRASAGQTGGNAVLVLGSSSPLQGLGVIGIDSNLGSGPVTGGSVTIEGSNSFGLNAASIIGSATASGTTITTTGEISPGIIVNARQDAAAGFSLISTQGDFSSGVTAGSTLGSILVRGGSVVTQGQSSTGVDARATTGRTDVALTGPVTTNGAFSPGVLATSGQGDVSVRVTDVTTSGVGAYGILASGVDASIVSTGTLTTTGTGGQTATAAQANAGSGVASIQINNASTRDDGARAALAISVTGNAVITATGTVSTTGTGARALDAQAGAQASVTFSGTITTSGDFATGVMAGGPLGAVVSGTGLVTTSGANAAGVIADGIYAPASVTVAAVRTSGEGAYGIRVDAPQSSGSVNAASVSTTGRAADALFVLAPAGISVNAGNVSTSGDFARGIVAQADNGPVTITSGTVATTGVGSGAIVGLAGGAVTVTSGTTSALNAAPVYLQSNSSTAQLTVTGATTAANFDAVSVNATTAASLIVTASGSISSGTNAAVISGTTTNVVNAGTLTGGSGAAIAAYGGAATIQNSGTINGRIITKDGADSITNSGVFNAVDGSDFGGGNNSFTNTGVVNAAPAGTGPTRVTFANLASFTNSGILSLANGRVGDELVLPGSYTGNGGTLRLDVAAGSNADRLVVAGGAIGSTRLDLVFTGNAELIPSASTVVVDAGAGSSATAFALAPDNTQVGFAQYRIAFDSATGDYMLAASPSTAAQRPLRLAEGARNIWYLATDGIAAHLRDRRDTDVERSIPNSRLWGQAFGSVFNRRDGDTSTTPGTGPADTLAYRQDFFGGQLGYDLIRPTGPNHLSLGVTGGYVSSDLNFATSAARSYYDTATAGLYAGVTLGPVFLNATGLFAHHWLDLRDQQPAYSRKLHGNSYGATGEVGLHIGNARFYAEPIATLAWVKTDLSNFDAYSSRFNLDAANGLRGKLGLRLGYTLPMAKDGTRFVLYAGGSAVREFRGRDALDFLNNGISYRFQTSRIGTYGEGTAGVRIVSAGRASGFIEGIGQYGGRDQGIRGGGGRVGINVAL